MEPVLFWCYFFQVLGLCCVLLAGVHKQKKWILVLNFAANVCSTLVMLLAGRYDGAAATVICTIRAFLFLFRERVRGNKIFWGCVVTHVLVGVISWQSPLSLLIIIAPVVLCSVYWFGGVRTIKYGTIVSDSCWVIFDLSSGIYIEAARDISEILANLVGLFRAKHCDMVSEVE